VLTEPGKRLIDEAIGRHVANEERLLLSRTEDEQETLDALLKKLIAGFSVGARSLVTESSRKWPVYFLGGYHSWT
jgi:hypothetical protein